MRRIRWRTVLVTLAIVVGVAAAAIEAVAAAELVVPLVTRRSAPPSVRLSATSRELLASLSAATPREPVPPSRPKTQRQRLLAAAYGLRGVPYKWAAKGPRAFDCSGFTKAAYAAIGVRLPDGSFNQATGEKCLTSMRALAPGDLLFYRWSGAKNVSHVTIYVGEGWAIGTGSPGQLREVVVYPLADDLSVPGTVITYRHIRLGDDHCGG